MQPALHRIGLEEPLAERVAEWILESSPGRAQGDLTGCLVLLPSVRACAALRHALLDLALADRAADGLFAPPPALLLPEIVTPRQLAGQLAMRMGLGAALAAAPPDELRPLLLARRLRRLEWVARNPESAGGLADELVRTFDEARRALAGRVLEGEAADPQPELNEGQREILARDLRRLREAFRLYREVVPADAVDLLAAVAQSLAAGAPWPAPASPRVVVAGFSDLDAATAAVLNAALAQGEGHVFASRFDDRLCRDWVATFLDAASPAHPLAPSARALEALRVPNPGDARARAAGHVEPELISCANPEDESRAVAARICDELAAGGGRPPRIGVATADRALARRIVAQLRDTGISGVDDTGGQPLAATAAGRLVHFALHAAVTDLRHGPLLEALTHPFARLAQSRAEHSRRTLLFERSLRGSAPPSGLAEYRRQARERDEAWRASHPAGRDQQQRFVEAFAGAWQPLLARREGEHTWTDLLRALRGCWRALAPDHDLDPRGDAAREREDVRVLAGLLERLDRHAAALGVATLAGFAAEIDRLLASPALAVRPRRAAMLPVQVMGLLEARLERFDLLILAGADDETLPGRQTRPLLLGAAARAAMGLPGWRDRLGLQAELFLRLIHNGSRVVVTWTRERGGQPALPSPFVERLFLAKGIDPRTLVRGGRDPLWRRSENLPDRDAIAAAQRGFAAERADIPVLHPSRPLREASHSGLNRYRQCPYRFLVEKGWGLAETEEVLELFRPLDHGRRAHVAMQSFLAPGGEGLSRLAAGDRTGALARLRDCASDAFASGAGSTAQRRLWESAFMRIAPAIVETELERQQEWKLAAVELPFALPLGALVAWLARELAARGRAPESAGLSPEQQAIVLRGVIDRVDLHRSGDGRAAVIDYKTGTIPKPAGVLDAEQPQLLLYAIAVEAGAAADLGREGVQVVQGGYYRLLPEQPGLPKWHFDASGRGGRAPLVAGARAVLAAALGAGDRRREFPLIPEWRHEERTDGVPCRLCPHRGTCRIDERIDVPAAVASRLAEERRR